MGQSVPFQIHSGDLGIKSCQIGDCSKSPIIWILRWSESGKKRFNCGLAYQIQPFILGCQAVAFGARHSSRIPGNMWILPPGTPRDFKPLVLNLLNITPNANSSRLRRHNSRSGPTLHRGRTDILHAQTSSRGRSARRTKRRVFPSRCLCALKARTGMDGVPDACRKSANGRLKPNQPDAGVAHILQTTGQ
jgi:hypothetical protein